MKMRPILYKNTIILARILDFGGKAYYYIYWRIICRKYRFMLRSPIWLK